MNIFVLDLDPVKAARAMDCVRVPKMVTESAQMMASALRRHGATDDQMPLTKSGRPYRGGYARHPCSIFVGDSRANFEWLSAHAIGLCFEYSFRFGKKHACEEPIKKMAFMANMIPEGELTPFALAMPDEYKTAYVEGVAVLCNPLIKHAEGDDAVKAYRAYYHSKTFAKWEKGTPAPDWWLGVEVTA